MYLYNQLYFQFTPLLITLTYASYDHHEIPKKFGVEQKCLGKKINIRISNLLIQGSITLLP